MGLARRELEKVEYVVSGRRFGGEVPWSGQFWLKGLSMCVPFKRMATSSLVRSIVLPARVSQMDGGSEGVAQV
jgi:hypothetical protein